MKFLLYIVLILLAMAVSFEMGAQCAMCKATAESSMDGADNSIGKGLNSGIIYLMLAPYALLLLIGVVFFRKKIAKFYRDLSQSY